MTDSTADTLKHIRRVQELLGLVAINMVQRGITHDQSKLRSPEKELFDEWSPKLAELDYGSDEYKDALKSLGPALDHHYANNSHHPEHYPNGVNDMTLFDIVEMLMDWKAASERHKSGDIYQSIEHNTERFGLSDQLAQIFENTARSIGWDK